ncbi:MAG: anaerobic ribonucleoside-triphosphate reductase activating protein [Spirochaetaceae bacterium]|nr:anaerobic ribonucleoside-triphosphate reductase activating protein [Spirochaetaceae bacterium]
MDVGTERKIGVLVKTSFVDFPGRMAATIFLCGCNLYCPYCYNKELVATELPEEELVSITQIICHLKKRKNVLKGFVISGGEPTISPYTEILIQEAKKLGYEVKLDSNGMLPDKIATYIQNPLLKPDYFALDVKTSPERYNLMGGHWQNKESTSERIQRSIDLIATLPPTQREFRTVLVPGIVDDQEIISIGELLPKDAIWWLARFKPGTCIDSSYNKITPYSEEKYQALLQLAQSKISGTKIR